MAEAGPPSPPAPPGPGDDKVSVSWLILQRLDDLRREQDVLRQEIAAVRREIAGVRNWSLGLLLLAVLGLLAKLLLPGA